MSDFINNKRSKRSLTFANEIMAIVNNYVPNNCQKQLYYALIDIAAKDNLEIISVPIECDHLDKLELERKMLQIAIEKIEPIKELK